jgi:hypothetical protein
MKPSLIRLYKFATIAGVHIFIAIVVIANGVFNV